jgi:hypothetical protein
MALPPCPVPFIVPEFAERPGRSQLRIVGRSFVCGYEDCRQTTTTYSGYEQHFEAAHVCPTCYYPFPTLHGHECDTERQVGGAGPEFSSLPSTFDPAPFTLLRSAHKNSLLILFQSLASQDFITIQKAFETLKPDLNKVMLNLLSIYRGVKVRIFLEVLMEKDDPNKRQVVPFSTPALLFTYASSEIITSKLATVESYFQNMIDTWEMGGSNWRLKRVETIKLEVAQYRPIYGGGRKKLAKYPLPKKMRRKGILIPQVEGSCFLYAVMIALYNEKITMDLFGHTTLSKLTEAQKRKRKRRLQNPSSFRLIKKKLMEDADFSNFMSDVSVEMLELFESKTGISVNLFSLENEIFPLRLTKKLFDRHINLVLLYYPDCDTYHFGVATSLSKLFGKRNYHTKPYCRFCLKPKKQIEKHESLCSMLEAESIFQEQSGKQYEFRKFTSFQDHAFKFFFNFILIESDLTFDGKENPLDVFGYSVFVVGPNNQVSFKDYYCGEDAMEKFIKIFWDQLWKAKDFVKKTNLEIKMNNVEMAAFDKETSCKYCKKLFANDKVKVRHHNHIIEGHPVMAVCSNCNILIQQQSFIAITHDPLSVSFNLMLKGLEAKELKYVKIIPGKASSIKSMRISGASCINFCNFIDEDLVEIGKWTHAKPTCGSMFQNLDFLRDTFVFPQLKSSNLSKLNGPLDIGYFSSQNNEEAIQKIERIWLEFGLDDMKQFLKIFMVSRTTLLADAVVSFVKYCMGRFEMSPIHYVSISSYAYTVAMYNSSEPYTFPPTSVLSWLKNGKAIRGGITMSNVKLSKGNSELLGNFNGVDVERQHILSIDCNSNYSSQALLPLPIGGYYWLTEDEIGNFDITAPADGPIGWIFEVDCEIPEKYHDELNCFPPCPYKSEDGDKLMLDFFPKKNYITEWGNLKYYVSKGVTVSKIHRILQYEQRPVLADFVGRILAERINFKLMGDKFGEQILKMIANSMIGKFSTDTSKYVNTYLVQTRRRMLELVTHSRYQGAEILDESLSIVRIKAWKSSSAFPLLWGFKILESSKLCLYRAFYRFQTTFPGVKLCGANTDGLSMLIPDPHNILIPQLKSMEDMFDFSNLTGCSEFEKSLYSPMHISEPGRFKFVAVNIIELIYLTSKNYSYVTKEDVEACQENPVGTKVCSLMPRAQSALFSHKTYQDIVNTSLHQTVTFMTVKKSLFNPAMTWTTRIGFRDTRNRRFFLPNGFSLAFNHFVLQ